MGATLVWFIEQKATQCGQQSPQDERGRTSSTYDREGSINNHQAKDRAGKEKESDLRSLVEEMDLKRMECFAEEAEK